MGNLYFFVCGYAVLVFICCLLFTNFYMRVKRLRIPQRARKKKIYTVFIRLIITLFILTSLMVIILGYYLNHTDYIFPLAAALIVLFVGLSSLKIK